MNGRRGPAFWFLALFFALFVLFLDGPTLTILVLSFQGPSGGLTFPMNGVSIHWFKNLFEKQMVGDFYGSFERSMILGVATMLVTVLASFSAGLAFRSRFMGSTLIFYLAIASLIEAARDGGASGWQTLRFVVIPLCKPGIAIGSIFVVTIVMGDFVTVRLMSGGQSASVGLMMMNAMSLLQYPAAAANAVVLLILVLITVAAMMRLVDIRKEL